MTLRYSQLEGDKKVERNWTRACSRYSKGDYSGTVISCVTSVELTVNFLIHHEMEVEFELPEKFVTQLMKDSSSLYRKYNHIYLELIKGWKSFNDYQKLWKPISVINKARNKTVHDGELMNKATAKKALVATHTILNRMLMHYETETEITRPDI